MKKMVQYEESIWYDNKISESETLGEVLFSVLDLIELYGEDTKISFGSGSYIEECILLPKEREETDWEYQFRLKQEQKKEDKERKEYERLKAKFGDK